MSIESRFALDLAILGRQQIKQRVSIALKSIRDLPEHARPQFVIQRPSRFPKRALGGFDRLVRSLETAIGIFADRRIGRGVYRRTNVGRPHPRAADPVESQSMFRITHDVLTQSPIHYA